MKLHRLASVFVLVSLTGFLGAGCVISGLPEEGTLTQNPNPKPVVKAQLELTWVSGHLGSYWDCPSNGFDMKAAAGEAPADAGPGMADAAGAAEPCAPGEECNDWGPLNCEDAQVTLVVKNVGTGGAADIELTDLELLTEDLDPLADLEILSISRTDGHDLTGRLGIGDEMTIRVEFRGPTHEGGWGSMIEGAVRLIMVTGDDTDAELVTPPLHSLAAVAT